MRGCNLLGLGEDREGRPEVLLSNGGSLGGRLESLCSLEENRGGGKGLLIRKKK